MSERRWVGGSAGAIRRKADGYAPAVIRRVRREPWRATPASMCPQRTWPRRCATRQKTQRGSFHGGGVPNAPAIAVNISSQLAGRSSTGTGTGDHDRAPRPTERSQCVLDFDRGSSSAALTVVPLLFMPMALGIRPAGAICQPTGLPSVKRRSVASGQRRHGTAGSGCRLRSLGE